MDCWHSTPRQRLVVRRALLTCRLARIRHIHRTKPVTPAHMHDRQAYCSADKLF